MHEPLLKSVLTFVLRALFRVRMLGVDYAHTVGKRALIIANHQSFLDPLLLAVFLPEKPAFAMNVHQAAKWYFRWLGKLVTIYKLDPLQPLSMKHLIHDLREGKHVVIFPEGRITTSGGIMKIYEGAGLLAAKTGAPILPVHIEGADYSKLSRLGGKLRCRWFPSITLTVLEPRHLPEHYKGQKRVPAHFMYDIMCEAAFAAARTRRPVLKAIIDAAAWHGGRHRIATDMTRAEMTYRQLFTRAFILSGKLRPLLASEYYVAVMLPNALGVGVVFTALHMLGKVPCMLNFSSGEGNLAHACQIAGAKTVLTSRQFIEKGKLESAIEALAQAHRIIYLEDIRPGITLANKLCGAMKAFFPAYFTRSVLENVKADHPAAVLYTSGSEGKPKGVALSHANILSNIHQACSRLDLLPTDILFNALPVFHSFGLTIGLLMPMARGIKTFLYPSPLHYRVIPELVYDSDATIMLGTDTFFNGYARYAHSYDFWNIRLAVAGAEKLKESTRHAWVDRFRVPIMQGYGVTETSPAISFNTPMEHKPGTVGRPFPGMECRLEKVEGIEQGGRLLIKGPNVMLGYFKADKPGVIQPQGEWYDTGDIVDIDTEGFITILGRAKRFAKIGGEMVSLLAVEELASVAMPDVAHAAIAIPDERKGEQILLFSEAADLTREMVMQAARAQGIAEIYLPKKVIAMQTLPRLGNGKIDYVTLREVQS